MAQALDDEKNMGGGDNTVNAWTEVFTDIGGNVDVIANVNKMTEWGLGIMDMLYADKHDRDQLCETLGLDGSQTKKFHESVKKCMVKYSEWSFLRGTLVDDEKDEKSEQLIRSLNVMEKPSSMINDEDLQRLCGECKVKWTDVQNVIGWYKALEPLTQQTNNAMTVEMVAQSIKKLYSTFDLPFLAMEEADDEDITQLAGELGFDAQQIDYFRKNVASQLRLQGLMSAIKVV